MECDFSKLHKSHHLKIFFRKIDFQWFQRCNLTNEISITEQIEPGWLSSIRGPKNIGTLKIFKESQVNLLTNNKNSQIVCF